MVLTATKLFVNTVSLGFTPTGGSLSTLVKITKTSFDGGVENIKFKGDGDIINSCEVNVNQTPSLTVEGGYVSAMLASVAGLVGSLSWTWPDARNGIVSGSFAMSCVLSNALLASKSSDHPHANFASASNMFSSFSTDGATNPFGVTIL